MKGNQKLGTFLCGMLSAALMLGCGTGALAAVNGGEVSFGSISLSISGKTVLEKGQTITNSTGQEIPSSILYTDAAGGGTTYIPLAAFSDLLDIPVTWDGEKGLVNLGAQRGETDISFGMGFPENPIWETNPLHHAGAKAGYYTELEPYWPTEEEITGTSAKDTYISSPNGYGQSVYPYGECVSISITNQSDAPLIFSVKSISTVTMEAFPDSVIPVGETVIRTFSAEEYPTYLLNTGLEFSIYFDPSQAGLSHPVKATINSVNFRSE